MRSKFTYNVGSLFAGIGGVCLAFKKAGAKVLWANELDKYACKTYRANFAEHNLFECDVRTLTGAQIKTLGQTDILTAGFPCQPFSIAGHMLGFEDPRGNLFFEIIRLIKKLQPKAILLENVRNLETHDDRNTFQRIRAEISKLGYSFQADKLNAHIHSELPQNRNRIFIVGFREDIKDQIIFEFPSPVIKHESKPMSEYVDRNRKQEAKYYYTSESQYYKMFKRDITNYKSIYHLRRVYVREIQGGLCPTLTANMGLGGHNVPLIKDRWGIRKLTPRECANFQGFTNKYILPSEVSSAQLYKQIGNSVAVPLVKRIADNIISALNSVEKQKTESIKLPQREMAAELA